MPDAYHYWYETVDDSSLRQGDIFTDLVCYWLANDLTPYNPESCVERERGTWMIAQASCDMQGRHGKRVVMVEVLPANRQTLGIGGGAAEGELMKRLEVIRRGVYPRRFLMPKHPDPDVGIPLSMVVWQNLATLPTEYLRAYYCKRPRLRLKSPLREQFGNWVGTRFSAVGPEDTALISRFMPRMHDHHVLDATDSLEATSPDR